MDLPKGDVMLMKPNFVHSGAAGVPGDECPRVHMYCEPVRPKNTTLLVGQDKDLMHGFNWSHERGPIA
jgi:hypothetical protein